MTHLCFQNRSKIKIFSSLITSFFIYFLTIFNTQKKRIFLLLIISLLISFLNIFFAIWTAVITNIRYINGYLLFSQITDILHGMQKGHHKQDFVIKLETAHQTCSQEKHSENMQQIYRGTLMPKCATLSKSHLGMGVLLQICCIFSEHPSLRKPLEETASGNSDSNETSLSDKAWLTFFDNWSFLNLFQQKVT